MAFSLSFNMHSCLRALLPSSLVPPRPRRLGRIVDDALWHLITMCWQQDPVARPTMGQVRVCVCACARARMQSSKLGSVKSPECHGPKPLRHPEPSTCFLAVLIYTHTHTHTHRWSTTWLPSPSSCQSRVRQMGRPTRLRLPCTTGKLDVLLH